MSISAGSSSSDEREQPRHCCLSHEFSASAKKNLHKIAVVHVAPSPTSLRNYVEGPGVPRKPISNTTLPPIYEGDRCFTFSDVLNAVASLASRLRSALDSSPGFEKKGESKGKGYRPRIVGVYMPPSVEYVVSVLSILRCGEAFLPLDPLWPRDRVSSILSSSNADIVFSSSSPFAYTGYKEVSRWDWMSESCGCNVLCFSVEEVIVGEKCGGDGRLEMDWPCEKEVQRMFCYLMYTSGSTGLPKGVCGTEQGLLNRFLWMQGLFPLSGLDILLFKTSISFIDHLQEFLSAMLSGCTLVIPPFNELKQYPYSLVDLLQRYLVNRITAVPSLMRAILPAFRSLHNLKIQNPLKLLVLSGEVFPLSLWDELSKLLPGTSILNLYGSTEVSGDCTYFDCMRLPRILEMEAISSVPIGVPIPNCDVVLASEADTPNQGEVFVSGLCLCNGYFYGNAVVPLDQAKMHMNVMSGSSEVTCENQVYFKTGDLARQLACGDLVFLGRKDRTIKVNGQRVALEEIENTIRRHPDVVDAAVISHESPGELLLVEAFLVLRGMEKSSDLVRSSFRSWMFERVPPAMVPNCFVVVQSLPVSSSGKVDYALLASENFSTKNVQCDDGDSKTGVSLQVIKKVFCDALMIEEVSSDCDFFEMGGTSITAAHTAYNLGIDMRLLYNFPTPSKLHVALLDGNESYNMAFQDPVTQKIDPVTQNMDSKVKDEISFHLGNSDTHHCLSLKSHESLQKSPYQDNDDLGVPPKRFKVDLDSYVSSWSFSLNNGFPWSTSTPVSCSFSRANKVIYEGEYPSKAYQVIWSSEVLKREGYSIRELWNIHMESCVDASPLLVLKDRAIYLFIGSHSHKFICTDANSGIVQWEVTLEGRIECSAAIIGDFSQVVVGCYKGKIYFLDFHNGNIRWSFQTNGEVKAQPVVDKCRRLIWCGSHDHNLYALDYINCCCLYKLPCGGSVFGSPAINEVHDLLYVGSTSGRVTALSVKALPFHTLWQCELKVPIFASLSVSSPNGNVICCLVDGNIVVLDTSGSMIWKNQTGGPVFGGPCTTCMLPSQVLICSRSGSVYSFDVENGDLLWEYNVGDPITVSAYVDEHLQLVSDESLSSERLVCVCTSSGSIVLLHTSFRSIEVRRQIGHTKVQEFARLKLPGDIFSSPVMVCGRLFVGCRDDHVHCIAVQLQNSVE